MFYAVNYTILHVYSPILYRFLLSYSLFHLLSIGHAFVYTVDGIRSARRTGNWKKTKVPREFSELHMSAATVLSFSILNLIIFQNANLDLVLDLAPKLHFLQLI